MRLYRIKLMIGDWSGDGHMQSDDFFVDSNLEMEELKRAFALGCEELGIPTEQEKNYFGTTPRFTFCNDYEDETIPPETIEALKKSGFGIDKYFWKCGDNEPVFDGPEKLAELYLDIVKVGNDSFQYTLIEPDMKSTMAIGGYGLY